jgi:phage protein D
MSLPEGRVKLVYAGKDVTRDLLAHLLSITYTDKVEGASDELALELEDVDGLWTGAWYPKKGDKLQAWMGDSDGLFPCGSFEVDKLGSRFGVFTMAALAAGPGAAVRSARYVAYKDQTLKQIAGAVAQRNGFTLAGSIPDVTIARTIQDNTNDLAFLAKLAQDYGLVFSLRGDQLVFSSIEELEGAAAILTLDKLDLQPDYSFEDNLVGTYSSCEVTWHTSKKKAKTQFVVTATDASITSGNTLRVHRKVDNEGQAKILALAALHRANTQTLTGSITPVEGVKKLLAGVNINLTGLGVFSRKWHVTESTHRIDKAGSYAVSAQLKGVS